MEKVEPPNRLSNHYSNEDIAISIGEIVRENLANKDPKTNKPNRITRRHLVDLLNKKHENLNLADTIEVNEIVKYSYEMSSSLIQEAIVRTIEENLGNDSVYNPKRIYPSNQVFRFSEKEKDDLTNKILLLKANAAEINSDDSKVKIERTLVTTQDLKFKKEFLGIGNADSAKEYALNVLSGYELMIEEYDKIKNINLNLVNDFHILRNELKTQRDDVVQLLIDLLGVRAKQQFPELFDFSQISWSNFEESWEKLNLSYNKINDQHSEFVNTVDAALDDFGDAVSNESSKALKSLSAVSKKRNLSQADLIGAGAQVAFAAGAAAITAGIKTRNKSKETVAMIQREVEVIKNKMSEDKEQIVADIFRLGKLYSKLSDDLLPNYYHFIKSNSDRITSELRPWLDKIMQTPVILKAKTENNELFKRKRFLIQKNIDFNSNIKHSEEEEIRLGKILENKKEEYLIVLSLKPKNPFILIELFTFGRSSKIYHATMDEWTKYCKPVADDYEFLEGLQKDEIVKRESISEQISEVDNELISLDHQIASNSDKIKTEYEKSPFTKEELYNLVSVVKKLINASREVLEVKLDQDLQKKAVV